MSELIFFLGGGGLLSLRGPPECQAPPSRPPGAGGEQARARAGRQRTS